MVSQFKEYPVHLETNYQSSKLIIEKLLEYFNAVIIQNAYDIETIYCDILIKQKFKVCFNYHDMFGIVIVALDKDSEEVAEEIARFIDKNFSIL